MATETLLWLGVILMLPAMLGALAVSVLYIIFLHKANKIFKTLVKTEQVQVY